MIPNPFAPDFVADRYDHYRQLRDEHPVATLPMPGPTTWLLTRHEHVSSVLKDPRSLVRASTDVPAYLGDGPSARFYAVKMSLQDPPDHTRLRKLVNYAFTPLVVDRYRAEMAKITDELLDELEERNEVDIVGDFGARLPATVICRLAGVPEADWELLIAKAYDFLPLLAPFPLDPDTLAKTDAACQFYFDYFGASIDELARRPPRDDLLGALMSAEEEGSKLTRDELIATLESFVNAGYETTTSSIGNAVLALTRDADARARLAEEPRLATAAFEETLRWESPVQFLFRFLAEPTTVLDTTINPGEMVMLGVGAANRDDRAYPEPDRFDIDRSSAGHLALGGGRHFCLGAHLARLEGEIALRRLIGRFPRLELAGDPPERRPMAMFPSLPALPVVLEPSRS